MLCCNALLNGASRLWLHRTHASSAREQQACWGVQGCVDRYSGTMAFIVGVLSDTDYVTRTEVSTSFKGQFILDGHD